MSKKVVLTFWAKIYHFWNGREPLGVLSVKFGDLIDLGIILLTTSPQKMKYILIYLCIFHPNHHPEIVPCFRCFGTPKSLFTLIFWKNLAQCMPLFMQKCLKKISPEFQDLNNKENAWFMTTHRFTLLWLWKQKFLKWKEIHPTSFLLSRTRSFWFLSFSSYEKNFARTKI